MHTVLQRNFVARWPSAANVAIETCSETDRRLLSQYSNGAQRLASRLNQLRRLMFSSRIPLRVASASTADNYAGLLHHRTELNVSRELPTRQTPLQHVEILKVSLRCKTDSPLAAKLFIPTFGVMHRHTVRPTSVGCWPPPRPHPVDQQAQARRQQWR